MAIYSQDINEQGFTYEKRGYNIDQVDVFLERVANELDEMNAYIADLEDRVRSAGSDDAAASNEKAVVSGGSNAEINKLKSLISKREATIDQLESEIEESRQNDKAVSQALIVAQRAADDIVAGGKQEANQINEDAKEEAQRILTKANADRDRIIESIQDLEQQRNDTRSAYQDMLRDFVEASNSKLELLSADYRPASYDSSATSAHGIAPASSEARNVAHPVSHVSAQENAVVVPEAPVVSGAQKDLSGFGDIDDDFDFADVK